MVLSALPKVPKADDLVPILAALEQRLTQAEGELGGLQTAIDSLLAENAELRRDLSKLRFTVTNLKRR